MSGSGERERAQQWGVREEQSDLQTKKCLHRKSKHLRKTDSNSFCLHSLCSISAATGRQTHILILKSCVRTEQKHIKGFNLCPWPFPPCHPPAGPEFVRERINPKSNKSLYAPCGGTAVGTKLLHLRAQKNRQQPSHLHVINPYSLLAAFLPFTTHCLKLKREKKGRGEGT